VLDLWSLRALPARGRRGGVARRTAHGLLGEAVARDRLPEETRAGLMRVLGMRFGIATVAVLIPLQFATGVALARHKGVTLASLADPGYGRMLAGKLVAFALVMLAAGLHGWAISAGRRTLARSLAVSSLAGSFVVVLLATALPVT